MLTVKQAAKYIGVHPQTIRRWCNEGKLQFVRIGSRGDRRIREGWLDVLLDKPA